ncbi:2-succinyl-5-enolpyruvyl-6-hydroxy-3-cyclohexene-1-carboxylic-acid synthase [Flavobacteriales bacterium]|jgi:2-succinyl-5-enolpyruvyl-6-hydroxy-3-cyclohexene-1-carboxylate synthase|nr:2-succinyl-5-enolpyruvyl-6-hydroxy-3-cyclohexene-1-carboxylic-acid synthase [Flavobacteriales bacterium]
MRTTDHPGAHELISTWQSLGLKRMVVSPGSRSAPLVLAADALGLEITVALDERSAAHIALGMALQSGLPACAITTSGTAALNHGSAMAEAFYMGVPLISVTADRPISKRHMGPGQMVVQSHAFESHVVCSLELDEQVMSPAELRGAATEAWLQAQRGPVHVNVPFDEPLYGMTENSAKALVEVNAAVEADQAMPEELVDQLSCHDPKVLVLLGAVPAFLRSDESLSALMERAAVFANAFGPIPSMNAETSASAMLNAWNEKDGDDFQPDAIITCGLPPMDKKWRAQLVDWKAPHWHIGNEVHDWDMFNAKVGSWNISAARGLAQLVQAMPGFNAHAGQWNVAADRRAASVAKMAAEWPNQWTDWHIYHRLSVALDDKTSVHFANSTSARYAQWFDWGDRALHANRGAAGIDGCLSTAVGDALANPNRPVVLLTGDAAWLYDANGLAVEPKPANLKVIVINNGGGNIFRWIDGPEKEEVLEQYFEAPFAENMKGSALQLGLAYGSAKNWSEFEESFPLWCNIAGPSLLELKTSGKDSAGFLQALRAGGASK